MNLAKECMPIIVTQTNDIHTRYHNSMLHSVRASISLIKPSVLGTPKVVSRSFTQGAKVPYV